MLRKDKRGRPRGIRARHTGGPAHPEREEVEEVLDLVSIVRAYVGLVSRRSRALLKLDKKTLWWLSGVCNGGLSFREGATMCMIGRGRRRVDVSADQRAFSSTAPIRGVSALDLLCLAVHHLGVVHDVVIFSERVDRD